MPRAGFSEFAARSIRSPVEGSVTADAACESGGAARETEGPERENRVTFSVSRTGKSEVQDGFCDSQHGR